MKNEPKEMMTSGIKENAILFATGYILMDIPERGTKI